jgi:hypothetical protein
MYPQDTSGIVGTASMYAAAHQMQTLWVRARGGGRNPVGVGVLVGVGLGVLVGVEEG